MQILCETLEWRNLPATILHCKLRPLGPRTMRDFNSEFDFFLIIFRTHEKNLFHNVNYNKEIFWKKNSFNVYESSKLTFANAIFRN